MAQYKPSKLIPKNQLVDLLLPFTFSAEVNGDPAVKYEIIIYDSSDNSQEYTTGEQAISAVDNGERLEVVVSGTGISDTIIDLYWILRYANAADDWVQSVATPFKYVETPTVTTDVTSPVLSQKLLATGTYVQDQNISFNSWYYDLYDQFDNLILTTDENIANALEYEFSGFRDALTYALQLTVILEYETEYKSPLYEFTIDFEPPNILIKPTATQTSNGTVDVAWGALIQIIGTLIAGTIDYIPDFIYTGNTGAELNSAGIVEFDTLEIPTSATVHHVRQFKATTFDGKMIEMENTTNGNILTIGRNNTSGWFYKTINGITFSALPSVIDTSNYYIIASVRNTVYIVEYEYYTLLGYIDDMLLGDLDNLTLDEMNLLQDFPPDILDKEAVSVIII